ncbi:MAG: Terminase large subunit, T4likevirus-type, N-terminal [Thermoanaerobacterium sp.]|nr:Terminase large subunit, T4likevirus-type, N-terminal [Thermoanaerobacterium sp.]
MVVVPSELIECFESRNIADIKALVKWLFPKIKAAQNITDTQAYIVKRVAFSEVRRLSISAYTRYGKTQTIAIAVALYVLLNENKRIKFIGPAADPAGILRNYMTELILNSRGGILLNLADLDKSGYDRIKKEASRNRMTFKNGCEYRVISAHGQGFAAMGHGGDLIVMDEAALISREAYAKITRMLGDDPENSTLVELYNPWDRDTKAFDHSINPSFERIRITWRDGVREGRTTEEFIEEQKKDITPIEFTVLYESEFPEESEDSLYSLKSIETAETISFGFEKEINELLNKIEIAKKQNETEYIKFKKELDRYKKIISCDPADKGLDFSVIMWGIAKDNKFFEVLGIYSEPKTESMNLVGKIIAKAKEFIGRDIKGEIKIDKIGIGTGAESRLKEIKNEENLENIRVVGCHYGESAMNKDIYLNKKAENNFRLRKLFEEKQISLSKLKNNPNYHKLKTELLSMKWEITSNEKRKIIDPEKSPDFNDALVYFVWKDKKELTFDFI